MVCSEYSASKSSLLGNLRGGVKGGGRHGVMSAARQEVRKGDTRHFFPQPATHFSGSRKCSSAHSSLRLFCSGVPVTSSLLSNVQPASSWGLKGLTRQWTLSSMLLALSAAAVEAGMRRVVQTLLHASHKP